MQIKFYKIFSIIVLLSILSGCNESNKNIQSHNKNMLNVDMGAEVPSLDPQKIEDLSSVRVANDLFEGLVTLDQNNNPIPGLATTWNISKDGKTYIFHLRDNIKFSDGKPITASDFVYSWQRLVNPKTGSPYTFIADSIVNANEISSGKLSVDKLQVSAINAKTLKVNLAYPDHDFLAKCTLPSLSVSPKHIINKYNDQWVDPKYIVTSGAYTLKEHVVNGHLLITKNPYYYDAAKVKIQNVTFYPLIDTNASIAKYKSGALETTWSIPVDQLQTLSQEYKDEVHVTPIEGMVYFNLNMLRNEFKDLRLREALNLAIDRNIITKDVLKTGVVPLYSIVTPTVENEKYASLKYDWATQNRAVQIAEAKALYHAAGYDAQKKLKLTIVYSNDDEQKKLSLAIAAMWKSILGIDVTTQNQEWKTFLQTRHNGDYIVSFGRWYADYNGVSTYTPLYQCNSTANDSKYCNKDYDKYIELAQNTNNPQLSQKYYLKALNIALHDYATIPLYQIVSKRMIKPYVKGYNFDKNHLDQVQSKWFYY